jgi:hypothetical protein
MEQDSFNGSEVGVTAKEMPEEANANLIMALTSL